MDLVPSPAQVPPSTHVGAQKGIIGGDLGNSHHPLLRHAGGAPGLMSITLEDFKVTAKQTLLTNGLNYMHPNYEESV